MRAAIEVQGVGQRARPGGDTLRDVSLSVDYGEFVAIIGAGDSGQRELLEVMSAIRPPATGTVDWDQPVSRSGNVGYVPDAQTLPRVLPLARALGYWLVPGVCAAAFLAVTAGVLARLRPPPA